MHILPQKGEPHVDAVRSVELMAPKRGPERGQAPAAFVLFGKAADGGWRVVQDGSTSWRDGVCSIVWPATGQPLYSRLRLELSGAVSGGGACARPCVSLSEIRVHSETVTLGDVVASSAPIPPILHQSWKSRRIPETLAVHVSSWLRLHPTWRYVFWTDDDLLRLVKSRFPDFLPVYLNYSEPVLRADASRVMMMLAFGGVYADLDFEALGPFDPLLKAHSGGCVLGQEPFAHAHAMYDVDMLLCNALVVSARAHPFWEIMLAELRKRSAIKTISATGPRALTAAYAAYRANLPASRSDGAAPPVVVLEPKVWYPLFDEGAADTLRRECGKKNPSRRRRASCDELQRAQFRNPDAIPATAVAAHHWVHSWFGGSTRLDGVPTVCVDDLLSDAGYFAFAHILLAQD